ncbi:hypothetical protein GBO34_00735 [Roseivirga pacifica]|uniref:hypothetical protein n=1 Tax=Roseivirga pacifica TaxID=1267423 RepID=UPI0020943F65|nr:hypothetical protein [Roseivirga pacifica]MCO6367838.1 hypothetical protein [Roseivirga pacifica]MCO6377210.1 hypothetical protein [Roseivirga pacifica]
MSYLSEISRLTASNIGGLISIKLVRVQDVAVFPSIVNGAMTDEIELNIGAGWVEWFCTSQSSRLVNRHSSDMEGNGRNVELPFLIAKDAQLKASQLERATEDSFIVLFRDGNGLLKVFGSPSRPVRFKYDVSTGQSTQSKNGYSCSFYYAGLNNVAFYNAEDPEVLDPGTPVPVVIKWNDGESITIISVASPGDVVQINSRFAYTDFETNPVINP